VLKSAWTLLAVLLLAAPSPGAPAADRSAVRYGLCASRVADAGVEKLVRNGGNFSIVVTLTDQGTSEFRSLSEAHLGEPIEVVLDGLTLQRAQVYAPVSSGNLLLGHWRSKEAASRIARMLVDRGLDLPCGILD
jgi:hypothetical protein